MNLKQRLTEKKAGILKAWQETLQRRAAEGAPGFPAPQIAPAVPGMEFTFDQVLEAMFDALHQGLIPGEVSRFLDGMMKSRAANDIPASRSVEFILVIKKAVRDALGNGNPDDLQVEEELAAWETVVDDLVLFAFDSYIRHRESVLELKTDQAKAETLRLLKQAKLISDDQDSL